jgi:hypothetical protein
MDISFQHNIREVERGLSDFAQRQVPFATSIALNETAADVAKNQTANLSRRLDRPTRFTLRAFAILRSSKSRLVATVFAKDAQAKYLKLLEDGGTRKPKGKALVVPVNIRTNKHGNIARRGIKTALARPDTFSGKPGGGRPGGIYQRLTGGRGLRLLVDYAARAVYRPILGFKSGARKTAAARFPVQWERAIRRAIATARR